MRLHAIRSRCGDKSVFEWDPNQLTRVDKEARLSRVIVEITPVQ
jgi:hypothetical protein